MLLRELTEADAPFILGLLNEPAFISNIGDRGVRTLEDARAYIRDGPVASYRKHGFGSLAVELKVSRRSIGVCGMVQHEGLEEPDIGFAFLREFWSKGYATEAARQVMEHARSVLRLSRITAIVVPENTASIRVLEKLGLRYERQVQLPGDDATLNLLVSDVLD